MADQIKKYYNQVSDYGMNSLRRKKILSLAGDKVAQAGVRILDLGCASGYLAKELKRGDNFVAGLDISEKYAGELKEQLDFFAVMNVESDEWPMEFLDHKFDLIIMAEVLEHLFDQPGFLDKLKTILKPDGEIIISTPNFLLWNNRIRMLFGQYGEKEYFYDYGHIHLLSYDGLKKLISRAGYEITVENNIWYPNNLEKWLDYPPPNLFVFQSIFKIKNNSTLETPLEQSINKNRMSKFFNPSDIVLILPPKRFKEHRYSLGIMYISGYLRDHGYDNTILESKILGGKDYIYDRPKAQQEIIETTIKLQPKIIGFTATTIEMSEVIWLNSEIRKQINVYSIIGGSHVTAAPEEILRSGFDVAVIGEGELTTLELIKELEKDQPDLSKIKGIAWLNKETGQVVINEPRELIDISDISMPAYDKINMEYHTKVWDDVIRGIPIKAVMVMASRGCPYDCTFCACNRVFGRAVRYRGLESVKKEIINLRDNYGVEGIWFADDTMTVSYDHVQKICGIMKGLGMYWGAQSRVDLTDEMVVKLMRESGCLQLDFGLESGNQRVLDEIIHKRTKLADAERAFELCRKYDIRTEASFMIGLPGETKKEMEDTFAFAQKIKASHYSFSIFTPLPGTSLYDDYYKNGFTLADYQEINFHKTKDKFNKSEVKDIEYWFGIWRKVLFEGVKKRGLAHSFTIFKIWLELGNKGERIAFIAFKLRRAARYAFNKIGFKFFIN
ncbi:MAG: radical SAM protein [Patescibacteria group bacterium]